MELREVLDGDYFTWLLEPVLHRRINSNGPLVLVECVATGSVFSTSSTQRVIAAAAPVAAAPVATSVPLVDKQPIVQPSKPAKRKAAKRK